MAQTCCPIGYIYIDVGGFYDDIGFGSGVVANPPGYPGCVRVQVNALGQTIIIGTVLDPNECPCCRPDYEYSSFKAICMYISNPTQTEPTIPCTSPCVCPDPPDPFECTPCTSTNLAIHFAFDFTKKQCVDCEVEDLIEDNCFIANTLTNPIISNFRLRNTNLI